MEKETCYCGTRKIPTTAAFHYVDDKPVCTSACYNKAIQDKPVEVDGFSHTAQTRVGWFS